jgi:hypothetical protein
MDGHVHAGTRCHAHDEPRTRPSRRSATGAPRNRPNGPNTGRPLCASRTAHHRWRRHGRRQHGRVFECTVYRSSVPVASMPPGDVSALSTPSTMHPGPWCPSGDAQSAALAERRWSTKMMLLLPLLLPLPLLTSLCLCLWPLPTYLHSTYPLPTSSCCARPAMPLLLACTAAIACPRTSHSRACAARARHGRGSLAQRTSLASLAPDCRPPPGAALHRARRDSTSSSRWACAGLGSPSTAPSLHARSAPPPLAWYALARWPAHPATTHRAGV